jgi:hypothetical protein
MVGVGSYHDVPLPSTRTRLISNRFGGTQLRWTDSLDVRRNAAQVWYSEFADARTYTAGQRIRRNWSPAAFRPQGDGNRGSGGAMVLWFAPFSPSVSAGSVMVWDSAGIQGTAKLRRGGAVVAESTDPFMLDGGVQPGQPTTYVLDVDGTRTVPWSRYATKVHGRWVFASEAPVEDVAALELMNVQATGAFDGYGRAPAGAKFTLTFPVSTGPVSTGTGAGVVRAVRLSMSYDDGKTWTSVPVTKKPDGRWSATVTHKDRPGAFVSLKVTAEDDLGNRVDLTSIRAYGLYRAS